MKIEEFLKKANDSAKSDGPHSKIVLSSRVRFARNLRETPFPGWAKKADRIKILETIRPSIETLPEMRACFSESMDNLLAIDKQILVEQHLISREHAAKNVGSGIVLNERATISVMINEEDHLRMQTIRSGLQLRMAYKSIDKVDTELEEKLDFAFSPKLGYLTACPTNVGTGMRASVMLHLPAMVLSDQINKVVQAVNKLGLAVRGLYGEGTEALGNMFQVSNQTTLGEKESDLIERLNKVILQIIDHEENARSMLMEDKQCLVHDQIGRAYGILTNAYTISSKEALNLLSLLVMGVDLDLLPTTARSVMDGLFTLSQPAHVQKTAKRKLTTEERDMFRADLIRNRLTEISKPRPQDAQPIDGPQSN